MIAFGLPAFCCLNSLCCANHLAIYNLYSHILSSWFWWMHRSSLIQISDTCLWPSTLQEIYGRCCQMPSACRGPLRAYADQVQGDEAKVEEEPGPEVVVCNESSCLHNTPWQNKVAQGWNPACLWEFTVEFCLYLCTMVNTWCIIIIISMIVMHQAIAFVILELFGANQNKEWQSRARRKGKGSWLFHIPIYFHTLFISFLEIRFYLFFMFSHLDMDFHGFSIHESAFLSSALKSSTGAKHNLPAHLRPWRYTAVLKFAGISEPRIRANMFSAS